MVDDAAVELKSGGTTRAGEPLATLGTMLLEGVPPLRVRARTISIKRMSKRLLERGRFLYPDLPTDRPLLRSDCTADVGPCPWCLVPVVMTVRPAESDATEAEPAHVACPDCAKPVRFVAEADGSWHWGKYPANTPAPRFVPRSTYSRALNGCRPCIRVTCKYNLYTDVNTESGSVKLNFPDIEPWQMTESCALDVADRGGTTLEAVGEILNLTRERIRQLEGGSCASLRLLDAAIRLGIDADLLDKAAALAGLDAEPDAETPGRAVAIVIRATPRASIAGARAGGG